MEIIYSRDYDGMDGHSHHITYYKVTEEEMQGMFPDYRDRLEKVSEEKTP